MLLSVLVLRDAVVVRSGVRGVANYSLSRSVTLHLPIRPRSARPLWRIHLLDVLCASGVRNLFAQCECGRGGWLSDLIPRGGVFFAAFCRNVGL